MRSVGVNQLVNGHFKLKGQQYHGKPLSVKWGAAARRRDGGRRATSSCDENCGVSQRNELPPPHSINSFRASAYQQIEKKIKRRKKNED